jgi:hypothetical protein
VRIEKDTSGCFLYFKECDGTAGYDPGKLARIEKRELSQAECRGVQELLKQCSFWSLPTVEPVAVSEDGAIQGPGLDGAEWVLEAIEGDKHNYVDRWSPKQGPYKEACLSLLVLSGFDLKTAKVY